MHSRRAFITAGLAAVALAAVAIPDRALATAGADILSGTRMTLIVSTPRGYEYHDLTGFDTAEQAMRVVANAMHESPMGDAMIVRDEWDDYPVDGVSRPVRVHHREKIGFVDGVFLVPGGEQLRVFYRDQVYAPKHAAMQPDNGAGQVSGDKAQSVGKAGDLKAGRPGGVQSGPGGAKSVDARKQSWIGRAYRRFISPAYS